MLNNEAYRELFGIIDNGILGMISRSCCPNPAKLEQRCEHIVRDAERAKGILSAYMDASVARAYTLLHSDSFGKLPMEKCSIDSVAAQAETKTVSKFTTAELVNELRTREGVNVWDVEPYSGFRIECTGPAVILEVID